MNELRQELPPATPVEIWFHDEARVGQCPQGTLCVKNGLVYQWAKQGSRPRQPHDQRTA